MSQLLHTRLVRIWTSLPIILCLVVSVLAAQARADLDTIIIDQGVDNPIRIAVVPFALSEDLAQQQNPAKLISFDLARSGQFDPVASENMLSYPSTRNEVFFRDWRILQTAYLVIGSANTDVLGRVQIRYQLFDVATQTELQTASFSVGLDQWRDAGHKISDLIYAEVTGVRGAFSTKILYVLAEGAGTAQARYRLQIADVDGQRPRTLYSLLHSIGQLVTGYRRVAYVSFETGRPSIILQDVDGSRRERLTNFRGINGCRFSHRTANNWPWCCLEAVIPRYLLWTYKPASCDVSPGIQQSIPSRLGRPTVNI